MTIDIPTLVARDDVKALAVHEDAAAVIKRMTEHNERVGHTFGTTSPEYLKQVESFNRVIWTLFSFGFGRGAYVTRDGELSLLVQEGGFVFGVIFFRDRTHEGAPVQPGTWSVHS